MNCVDLKTPAEVAAAYERAVATRKQAAADLDAAAKAEAAAREALEAASRAKGEAQSRLERETDALRAAALALRQLGERALSALDEGVEPLAGAESPVPATEYARLRGVSRQVVNRLKRLRVIRGAAITADGRIIPAIADKQVLASGRENELKRALLGGAAGKADEAAAVEPLAADDGEAKVIEIAEPIVQALGFAGVVTADAGEAETAGGTTAAEEAPEVPSVEVADPEPVAEQEEASEPAAEPQPRVVSAAEAATAVASLQAEREARSAPLPKGRLDAEGYAESRSIPYYVVRRAIDRRELPPDCFDGAFIIAERADEHLERDASGRAVGFRREARAA